MEFPINDLKDVYELIPFPCILIEDPTYEREAVAYVVQVSMVYKVVVITPFLFVQLRLSRKQLAVLI